MSTITLYKPYSISFGVRKAYDESYQGGDFNDLVKAITQLGTDTDQITSVEIGGKHGGGYTLTAAVPQSHTAESLLSGISEALSPRSWRVVGVGPS